MKHVLSCVNQNGEQATVIYDNTDNAVFVNGDMLEVPDRIGAPHGMYQDWAALGDFPRFDPEHPASKTSDVRFLKVQLGLKCNYSCSYCKQASHVGEDVEAGIEEAKTFASRVSKNIVGIPERIEFWGGEPFVYWKHIQILTRDFRALYPEAQISIVTNGSLLDMEKLQWVIDNSVDIAISHDGAAQYQRGPDPLDDPEKRKVWQAFVDTRGKEGRMSFNCVLTPDNNNVTEVTQWFKDRLGEHARVNFEGVVNIDGPCEEEAGRFSQAQLENMMRSIYNAVADGSIMGMPALGRRFHSFYHSLVKKRPSAKLGQKCGMDRPNALAVDLDGNVLTCHNTGANGKHNIGHIDNIPCVRLNTSWHWSARGNCSECPVLQICQGTCMYLEGDDFSRTCYNEYHYALPILFGAIWLATGLTVIGLETGFKLPDIDSKKKVIPIKTV